MMANDEKFRRRVMAIASSLYPDISLSPHPDSVDLIIADGSQLSLRNIRAAYELSPTPEEDLQELVRHHFRRLLAADTPSLDDLSLEDVACKIFPQIMPVEYVAGAPLPLIAFPFSTETRIGLVADFPEAYMYLRQVELQRWETSPPELYDRALENLEKANRSQLMQMAGLGKNIFLSVAEGDGYDAARILSSRLQAYLASHLGETFRFALPNREYLIAWRTDCDLTFHRRIVAQVRADFASRPYPLASSIFVRNSEGNFHEQLPANS